MDLGLLAAKMPSSSTRSRLGVVETRDGTRGVNVDGNFLRCTWADPMVVDDGDPVTVEFYTAGVGQSRAHVSSRSTLQPRPRTGTVTAVPAGSPTITVEAGGISFETEPVNFTPAVNDKVHLDWGSRMPRAFGKVTTTAALPARVAPSPATPPPRKASAGSKNGAAHSSNTLWSGGGWGSWAGGGSKVHQGDYGEGPLSGAWFYGTQFKVLSGRGVKRLRFRTGQRLAVGSHNAAATFHFYAHNSSKQPSGDITRVEGPFDITLPAGASPRWIDLPVSFATHLINGGGIALYGSPYAGMQGRTSSSPDSGAIIIDWEG